MKFKGKTESWTAAYLAALTGAMADPRVDHAGQAVEIARFAANETEAILAEDYAERRTLRGYVVKWKFKTDPDYLRTDAAIHWNNGWMRTDRNGATVFESREAAQAAIDGHPEREIHGTKARPVAFYKVRKG